MQVTPGVWGEAGGGGNGFEPGVNPILQFDSGRKAALGGLAFSSTQVLRPLLSC